MRRRFYTSESVAEGHPDKICDQISDMVLDEVLRQDPLGRVACETFVTVGLVIVGGEITTTAHLDIQRLVRGLLTDLGYTDTRFGLSAENCAILNAIGAQSPDIALGVDPGGAGDQGTVVGYACRETPEFMPLPILLAHRLVRRLAWVRKEKVLDYLGPDGKSQVTVEYEGRRPVRVSSVVLAAQHTEAALDPTGERMSQKAREELISHVILPVIPEELRDETTRYFVNETGRFLIGGPQSDTGMTGRKIVVDAYGGRALHGGGAFSGKDPTKVDRSGAYMARYVAKNCVAAGLAEELEFTLVYVIGRPAPIALDLNTFGTARIPEEEIRRIIEHHFDFTPKGMIARLGLRRPIYLPTACYGHFGREEFPWEQCDMVDELRRAAGL